MENDSNNLNPKNNLASHLALFSAKAAIVLLLFTGLGSISIVVTGNIMTLYAAKIINKLETTPPENIENLQLKIRSIGHKIQPLLREIILLWKSASQNPDLVSPHQGNKTDTKLPENL